MKSLGLKYIVNYAKETSYPNSFQLHCLTLDAVNMFRFGERMKGGKCMIITCWLYYFLICFVKELGERGENFLIEQREKFCQHVQSFHLRAVFYGFLAITCAARFMDSKRKLWWSLCLMHNSASKRQVLGLRIQPWDFLLTFAGTWYPDKTTSWSKTLVRDGLLGVILI